MRVPVIAAVLVVVTGCRAAPPSPAVGEIERLDPALSALIPAGARIEKLADGFAWSEGPVWVKNGGFLLFSDIPKNTIWKWKESDGMSLYMKPSGFTGKGPFTAQIGR